MLRSAIAVLSGFLTWGLICVSVNAVLVALFPGSFREDWTTDVAALNLLLLGLSVVYSVISGYVTASLARINELKHVFAQSLLNLTFGLFVQIQFWEVMPLWYHLPFLALLIPAILLGGMIRVRHQMRMVAT